MARALRLELEGALRHVSAPGNTQAPGDRYHAVLVERAPET
jgi:hypothetical protein